MMPKRFGRRCLQFFGGAKGEENDSTHELRVERFDHVAEVPRVPDDVLPSPHDQHPEGVEILRVKLGLHGEQMFHDVVGLCRQKWHVLGRICDEVLRCPLPIGEFDGCELT